MSWDLDLSAYAGPLSIDVVLEGSDRPLALVGPNGAGKTTLLRVIAGAHPAQRGHIWVRGTPWLDTARGVNLPPEARGVGYVPQGNGLFPHLSVLDNVAFGLSTGARRRPRAERHDAARDTLARLDAGHLGALPSVRTLSGGEEQRVALARALVLQPELLLLDEPLAALDPPNRRAVRTALANYVHAAHCPAVVVTHDVRDVVALDATVAVLEAGRIVQRGTVAQLREAPATDYVAEFLGPT